MPGSPPIAGRCRLFRKSPFVRECVVGLEGLELPANHAVLSNRSLPRARQNVRKPRAFQIVSRMGDAAPLVSRSPA